MAGIEREPEFPQFDVVEDCNDHYYLVTNESKNKKEDHFSNSSAVHKRIVYEWRILQKNLPESIFVRVFESRIDLVRSAIIGAPGTPYHDGLFFFDLAFPSDYPNSPPKVNYRSFGMRLNPNLYSNGKVCLSLLNTWPGKKCEKWSPDSTILQVLLSIQALVLNEKPYYNEPYTMPLLMRHMHENRSESYSWNAFVLSCKTMLNLMKKPPVMFEDLVTAHFRRRGGVILGACRAYNNGKSRLGFFGESSSCSSLEVPGRFREAMMVLYPKLAETFGRLGCSLVDDSRKLEVNEVSAMAKKRGSLVKLFSAKMKEMLRLKRKKKKRVKGNADRIEPAPETEY